MKTVAYKNTACDSSSNGRMYVLMGLSRVGKTTAGRKAAALSYMPFYDSDELLYEAAKCTPRELYLRHGKKAFYRAEADVLAHFFSQHHSESCILALGGGVCDNPYAAYPGREQVYPLFLDVSEEVLFTRLSDEAMQRGSYPAFLGALPVEQYTEARALFSCLYERRKQWYTASAARILDVTALTTEEIAARIASIIEENGDMSPCRKNDVLVNLF